MISSEWIRIDLNPTSRRTHHTSTRKRDVRHEKGRTKIPSHKKGEGGWEKKISQSLWEADDRFSQNGHDRSLHVISQLEVALEPLPTKPSFENHFLL